MDRTYYVYILTNQSRILYVGVTNDLKRRMAEHRESVSRGFAWRYNTFQLVHFEGFVDVRDAIAREKEVKGWRRENKYG